MNLKKEINNLIKYAEENNYHLIMTEKDYFKLKEICENELDYLKVSLEIENFENFKKIIRSHV